MGNKNLCLADHAEWRKNRALAQADFAAANLFDAMGGDANGVSETRLIVNVSVRMLLTLEPVAQQWRLDARLQAPTHVPPY